MMNTGVVTESVGFIGKPVIQRVSDQAPLILTFESESREVQRILTRDCVPGFYGDINVCFRCKDGVPVEVERTVREPRRFKRS